MLVSNNSKLPSIDIFMAVCKSYIIHLELLLIERDTCMISYGFQEVIMVPSND